MIIKFLMELIKKEPFIKTFGGNFYLFLKSEDSTSRRQQKGQLTSSAYQCVNFKY